MSTPEVSAALHWADMTADRIIKQKGDKPSYVLASGITPSGVVHFGNFREVITVDLVARALRARGKQVRFIFSWDDYDTFRKVPANMPKQDELQKYLFQPIVDTPDPFGEHESYAAHHEKAFEAQLKTMGIVVEPIYQAKKYRAGDYKEQIKQALKLRPEIMEILNKHRSEDLTADWWPVSIYCEKHKTDEIKHISFDGDHTLSYEHENGHKGTVDLNTTSRVKLPWRVDWPMRWAYEKVDFEPGGKDHSSEGGSYTTAKEIVKLFGWESPVYLQYDFVSVKGAGGKMSSSKGNLVTVNDVLEVYEPEMVRWIFASYKSNVDFSISFDLDVIKTYEDFDRQERLAFGVEPGANEKKAAMARRVYELSQLHEGPMPKEMPFQPSFRHLCNVLQINDGSIEKARSYYAAEIKNDRDQRRFNQRAQCALNWLKDHAPEEFKFELNKSAMDLKAAAENQAQIGFVLGLRAYLANDWSSITEDKILHEKMYEIMHAHELTPDQAFPVLYRLLIAKPKGPKLANFILTIGQQRCLQLLPAK